MWRLCININIDTKCDDKESIEPKIEEKIKELKEKERWNRINLNKQSEVKQMEYDTEQSCIFDEICFLESLLT